MEKFQKARKTVQPTNYQKIDIGLKAIVIAKIKEISSQLEEEKITPSEAISQLSGILTTKHDYKTAAEFVIDSKSRTSFLHL